jgi:serine/threonine protein kinase
MAQGKQTIEVFHERPQWTDISISEVPTLPKLPAHITTSNPRFLARSHHSHVYLLDITDNGKTSTAVVKVFPKATKERYIKEVNAYRFLYHYGVPEQGFVPRVYGVLPSLNKKALGKLLGDSVPDDAPIAPPAAAVVMEYIQGGQPASRKNMTHTIAERALNALQVIHNAHVLHGDAEARNLLVLPESEEAVWIDFSASSINRDIMLAMSERRPLKQLLYWHIVPSFKISTDK